MYVKEKDANIKNGDNMATLFLCIEIFLARIIDVSLGTIRTVIVVKGKNFIGSFLGFIEVTVWFLVVDQALSNANNNIFIVISYSLGFAVGTYIGGIISKKFIKSKLEVQVITSCNIDDMIKAIRDNGYAVSIFKLEEKQNKYMLFMEVNSNKFNNLKRIIKMYDKKAFIVVNETMFVQNGYFGLNK